MLYGGYVHGPVARAPTDDERRAARILPELAELGWGNDEPSFRQVFTARFIPGGTREQWDEFNELQRRTTSPTTRPGSCAASPTSTSPRRPAGSRARRSSSTCAATARRRSSEGRQLASLIPGSRFVSLDGDNHLMLGDRCRRGPASSTEVDRFLADGGLIGQPTTARTRT